MKGKEVNKPNTNNTPKQAGSKVHEPITTLSSLSDLIVRRYLTEYRWTGPNYKSLYHNAPEEYITFHYFNKFSCELEVYFSVKLTKMRIVSTIKDKNGCTVENMSSNCIIKESETETCFHDMLTRLAHYNSK